VAVPLEPHIWPLETVPSGHERWEPLAKEIVPAATSGQDELEEQEAAPLGLGSLEVLPQEVRNRIFSYLPLPHLLKLRQVYPSQLLVKLRFKVTVARDVRPLVFS
jgi:hypothetical protein